MSEELRLGLNLMMVGMATVFAILFLVVLCGKLLIRWVNYSYPESGVVQTFGGKGRGSSKLAAIIGVVDIITGGRGKVESIKKVN